LSKKLGERMRKGNRHTSRGEEKVGEGKKSLPHPLLNFSISSSKRRGRTSPT